MAIGERERTVSVEVEKIKPIRSIMCMYIHTQHYLEMEYMHRCVHSNEMRISE